MNKQHKQTMLAGTFSSSEFVGWPNLIFLQVLKKRAQGSAVLGGNKPVSCLWANWCFSFEKLNIRRKGIQSKGKLDTKSYYTHQIITRI